MHLFLEAAPMGMISDCRWGVGEFIVSYMIQDAIRVWRGICLVGLVLAAFAGNSHAQPNDPETLKRAYEDTLAQLRNAQDRKNELAVENEKLRLEIERLKSQVTAEQEKVSRLQSQLDVFLTQSYAARSTQAAFSAFLRANPEIRKAWQMHFAASFPVIEE